MTEQTKHSQVVEAQGHLIDSQLLNVIFDTVIKWDASFEVLKFAIGRTNEETSSISMRIESESEDGLQRVLEELVQLGCRIARSKDALLRLAERDGCVPDDFYSTTNLRTEVRHAGRWIKVEHQRMDAVVVIEDGKATCRKLRDVKAGDQIVCGVEGVRAVPEFQERDRLGFAFMTNEISSERRVEVAVAKIAAMMVDVRKSGGKIAFVAGPVLVHTGGAGHFGELIRGGYVNLLLAGNALAVHDAEHSLFGTSLGVDLETGKAIHDGHRHHMRAINTICRAGGLAQAVEQGVLTSGIMYECIKHGVKYVLAGSIRDDGPIPDTVMDLRDAQDQYSAALADVRLVIVLSTMLHGIGVGNMLPSWVRMVCVDINPAVVTKLADRGSAQTIGLVTDVGLFLYRLAQNLRDLPA
jgi:lysine-ketoglutarate reductase/saccharopine dehydrogenase-like protein (TIGR00300 family)